MSYKTVNMWLTPNWYSRPEYKCIPRFVVIHWVGVANATLTGVYNYFEAKKYGKTGYSSAHEMIINQMVGKFIPSNEMSYAVGASKYTDLKYELMGSEYPNSNTYNIEVMHIDMDGNFNESTFDTLVERTADLLTEFGLNADEHLLRHFDITNKICPKLFVENPQLWDEFKQEVKERMESDKMDILTVKQPVNFLGKEGELEMINIDGHVYFSAKNLRSLGLEVQYIKDKNEVKVSL